MIVAIFAGIAKAVYVKPSLSVESLGANRTLTAVEAGLVMGLKPIRVITMMLYGLLLKRMVTVTETAPILKLMKVDAPQGEPGNPGLRQGIMRLISYQQLSQMERLMRLRLRALIKGL